MLRGASNFQEPGGGTALISWCREHLCQIIGTHRSLNTNHFSVDHIWKSIILNLNPGVGDLAWPASKI